MQQVGLPRLQHFVPIVQTAVKLLHGQLTTKGLPLQIGLQPEEEELEEELETGVPEEEELEEELDAGTPDEEDDELEDEDDELEEEDTGAPEEEEEELEEEETG